MGLTFKVRYKNHCTPQEQILTDGRWYLDSDCGRKLTGNAETSITLLWLGILSTEVAISTSATEIVAAGRDFVYVKNTGSIEVIMSLTSDSPSEYVIALAAGEAFASEVSYNARVFVKTASGTSTIEHFQET